MLVTTKKSFIFLSILLICVGCSEKVYLERFLKDFKGVIRVGDYEEQPLNANYVQHVIPKLQIKDPNDFNLTLYYQLEAASLDKLIIQGVDVAAKRCLPVNSSQTCLESLFNYTIIKRTHKNCPQSNSITLSFSYEYKEDLKETFLSYNTPRQFNYTFNIECK